jgi:hypothetical protein
MTGKPPESPEGRLFQGIGFPVRFECVNRYIYKKYSNTGTPDFYRQRLNR